MTHQETRRITKMRYLLLACIAWSLRPDGRTSEISVKAKFGIAPVQTVHDRRRGSKQVRAVRLKGKGRSEDRPNAVTLITLRLLRELRLCQVAIINYTRWPFLNRRSASVRRTYPRRAITRPACIIKIFCTHGFEPSTPYIRYFAVQDRAYTQHPRMWAMRSSENLPSTQLG